MRSGALLCVALTLCGGCASNPYASFSRLQSTDPKRVVSGFQEAIRTVRSVDLEQSSKKTFELEESDPVISIGTNVSYFELFRVNAGAGSSYELTIKAICSCFGRRKTLVVPRFYVLDTQGTLIAEGPQRSEPRGPGMSSNFHLRGSAQVSPVDSGIYYVLVAADNARVGAPVETIQDSFQLPSVSPGGDVEPGTAHFAEYDVLSSPVGKVVLEVERASAR